MKKKLRGVYVEINGTDVHIIINKSMGRVYSLSDSVWNYAKRGFTIHVHIGDKVQVLTYEDKPFKVEEVKSKFPDSPNWHRYWFEMKNTNERQEAFL